MHHPNVGRPMGIPGRHRSLRTTRQYRDRTFSSQKATEGTKILIPVLFPQIAPMAQMSLTAKNARNSKHARILPADLTFGMNKTAPRFVKSRIEHMTIDNCIIFDTLLCG